MLLIRMSSLNKQPFILMGKVQDDVKTDKLNSVQYKNPLQLAHKTNVTLLDI